MPIYSFRTGDMTWSRSQANCLHIPFWKVELHRKSNYRSEGFLVILEIEQRRWMLSCIAARSISLLCSKDICVYPPTVDSPLPLWLFNNSNMQWEEGSENKSVTHIILLKPNKVSTPESIADFCYFNHFFCMFSC
jgi:hypothetical protein